MQINQTGYFPEILQVVESLFIIYLNTFAIFTLKQVLFHQKSFQKENEKFINLILIIAKNTFFNLKISKFFKEGYSLCFAFMVFFKLWFKSSFQNFMFHDDWRLLSYQTNCMKFYIFFKLNYQDDRCRYDTKY